MPLTNRDFTQVPNKITASPPPYIADRKKYDSAHPNGDAPIIPTGLTLLKMTDFAAAPLGQTTSLPEIIHYSALETGKRPTVINHGPYRVLRHNLNTVDAGLDPLSGQVREGNFTHFFRCTDFYSKDTTPEITVRMRHRLGHSWWRANENDPLEGPYPYPMADGKLFFEDKTVGQLACYMGFKNRDNRSIRLVSGNDTSGMWAPAADGGWTNRAYGWKNLTTGDSINGLDLVADSGYIFRTDGVFYEIFFEIRYNPGGIGYHKGRMRSSTGAIYRDLSQGNTDADGWFNLPIEYEFKGFRPYSNPIAFTTGRQDSTNNPSYTGLCGEYEIAFYALYSGTIPYSWVMP